MGNKFYTPDGFTDQLPGVCAFKRELEARLRNLFLMNGYDDIDYLLSKKGDIEAFEAKR